ncbi:hypothetical protein, partial [Bartonella sp. CL70QHWL]|uniref:hypothetical protein n=1 Tax=Bartonella sp. CL70QHWL TaxID=3243539 RepID=UPI0035CF6DE3
TSDFLLPHLFAPKHAPLLFSLAILIELSIFSYTLKASTTFTQQSTNKRFFIAPPLCTKTRTPSFFVSNTD